MGLPKANDKRDRLIEAGRLLFHRQGFGATSLADIARESDVPLGNVYYYFKTKEDIAAAVIDDIAATLMEMAKAAEGLPSARDRIIAMLDSLECSSDDVAEHGCPMGGLCVEFAKRDTALQADANRLLLKIFNWIEKQLIELGRPDARQLAVQLWSSIQGSSILSLAMHDPAVLREEVERLRSLVRTL